MWSTSIHYLKEESIMADFKERVLRYQEILRNTEVKETYQDIIHFMRSLRMAFKRKENGISVGTLYEGLLDMTYFPLFTEPLLEEELKLGVVFIHEKACLELWVLGRNKTSGQRLKDLIFKEGSSFSLPEIPSESKDALLVFSLAEAEEMEDPELLYERISPKVSEILLQVENLIKKTRESK